MRQDLRKGVREKTKHPGSKRKKISSKRKKQLRLISKASKKRNRNQGQSGTTGHNPRRKNRQGATPQWMLQKKGA